MKAMILAAGLGTRMRPLTLTTPKPLLKVGNTTLIEHALQQLKKAGIADIVINVHHLREHIMQHCGDGSDFGLRIQYSIEDELLETGGGIFQALPLLGSEPFLVISADVWTDFPLSQLMQKKIDAAHLVLVDNPGFHPNGDFGLDQHNIVRDNLEKKFTYANIGIFHPDLFRAEKHGVFRLTKVLRPAIANGAITGEYYAGEWHNIGTREQLNNLRKNAH